MIISISIKSFWYPHTIKVLFHIKKSCKKGAELKHIQFELIFIFSNSAFNVLTHNSAYGLADWLTIGMCPTLYRTYSYMYRAYVFKYLTSPQKLF